MTYNPFSLKEKTILVTGAASGIGRAISIECARIGAKLVITDRNQEQLSNTFNMLEEKEHIQVIADLQNETDLNNLVEILPPIDGVVHCAGIVKTLPFQFVNKQDLNKIFEINFMAPAMISQMLLKKKKMIKSSSIVFISSISGVFCSLVGNSMYSASKGAINGLVKGMALDLAPKEIRVNSIVPGMIETNILTEGSITQEQLKEDMKRYPLKRYGKPEEVAYAAIYLLSDASTWVTGSNLLIDGGYTLL